MNRDKILSCIYIALTVTVLFFIFIIVVHQVSADVFLTPIIRDTVQIEPNTEELDQVSEPVGELTTPIGNIPTEQLSEVSESDDRVSEEIGDFSETAEKASENLTGTPVGEEYGLEEEATGEEMPLGDREPEGRQIGK